MSGLRTVFEAASAHWLICAFTLVTIYAFHQYIYVPFITSPLRKIPGPKLFAVTRWRLALEDWKGTRTSFIHSLHHKYGPVVRIGPDEVAFNSLSALRTIYGAGSGFERPAFYRMFDVYGRPNLFTLGSSTAHAKRKKLLSHAYSKSSVLTGHNAKIVEDNAALFLQLLGDGSISSSEIFTSLHFFSLDSISQFVFGTRYGGTQSLRGKKKHQALLHDIVDPARRQLSWFAIHLPAYTKWLYTRTGLMETFVTQLGLLPMQKPAVYSGIRVHTLQTWTDFEAATDKSDTPLSQASIMDRLWKHLQTGEKPHLDGLDIASETADQLLAGIDTTSNTLLFLIWALSLPSNKKYQDKLIAELDALPASIWTKEKILPVEAADKLPYLDAVIKETLRIYAPLPASEPRSLPTPSIIDGYDIPAYTVVSMSPYSLHRNAEIYPDPLTFNPDRWLGKSSDVTEMKKWFWAFSSGPRMCIGIHFAMAEMTTLLAAIYRNYSTCIQERQKGISPGIISRFELLYDETYENVQAHACYIDFSKRRS